ncbi:hypothetical protein [Micromonospora sp. WMMD1082]|uniref:hypothetical protein n=1 Tax=Micromonospora sp. WMMD1082 TaxID=3016104 RepID=UPI002417465A|nr:hypothetical protein [Micromonospora sp. WMMD1082]MDG4793122.1 hypothetical protein [Micromonospora sp. WMMD1082]
MCDAWDLKCQFKEGATEVAGAVADTMIGQLADLISQAQSTLITSTVTWWLYLPPVDVEHAPAAQTLQRWMLPFALIVSVGGIMWQSLLLIINRKGEPLVAVVKGLFTTALFGAVSLTGTQMLLRACESYTEWVLTWGMDCAPGLGVDPGCKTNALAARMQMLLLPAGPGIGSVLVVVVGMVVLVASIVQAMLLLFRNGAIIILAGMLQLAASGSFTAATSNWLKRVLGWLLAMVFYEPFAATSYAVAFMLVGDPQNRDISTWFTGAGMLGMTLVALPAMMRFFNWTVGAVQTTGNSAGMLAAAGAAGLHAVASRRGSSGMSATDYARDMDRRYPPQPSGGDSGSGTPRPTPPVFTGPSPTAGAAPSASTATTTTASASAGSATTTATTAGGSAAAGAGAGAAGAGAVGASAAAGPAAPVVAGVVVGAQVAGAAVKSAASTASRSTETG